MANTSYYLYQRYVKYGNSEYVPVYPPEYAISGDTGQNPVIKQENDPNCGYHDAEYRWHQEDISEAYICSGGNKYYEEIYQVSYDNGFNWENVVPEQTRQGSIYESGSSDCIEYRWVNMDISTDYICDECPDLEYRWIATTGYVCSGTNKMTKEIEQVSYDSGTTWQNVVPEESRAALPVIEYDSTDCGYVPTGYSTQYLTFIPVSGSSTFELRDFREIVSGSKIKYSLDSGLTWTELAYNTPTPTVNAGEKIMWKGELTPNLPTNYGIGTFTSTNRFDVEGNAMSLLYGDNFIDQYDLTVKSEFGCLFSGCTNVVSAENLSLPATTLADYCYQSMFQGCTGLTTAPVLSATALTEYCYASMFKGCTSLTSAPELPATTLATSCYSSMFNGCTSLTSAPELPATTLATSCYLQMFAGCTSLTSAPVLSATTLASSCYYYMFLYCTSLTTAPELPATTLAEYCYEGMFRGCASLTVAPELPATTLALHCYTYMFNGCTSLNSITCLATDISANNCTTNWVSGVANSGTFTKASTMTGWTSGVNGIPTNWTIANA